MLAKSARPSLTSLNIASVELALKRKDYMLKMICSGTTLLLVLVGLAAVPVPASANPVITHPTGTPLAVGSKLLGTNVGNVAMTTQVGNVECNSATVTATVTTNSTASGSKAEVTSASFNNAGSTECSSWTGGISVTTNPATNGLPWCLEEITATDVGRKRGGSCGSATRPIRFILAFTNNLIGTCTYQRSTAAEGGIQTDTEVGTEGVISITGQEWSKFEGGAGCPSSGKIDMSFTIETDAATAEPLYFSS
jgi:hypothetical protein